MTCTREKILNTSLKLFARDGYEAVSVSMIAGELGITKGALYKHYRNKRDIFDSIVSRMSEMDYERAGQYEVPQLPIDEDIEAYRKTSLEQIMKYTKAQFVYWTEEEFPSNFRKMLTLEQYRSVTAAQLYEQYLAGGPLKYMADIFGCIMGSQTQGMQAALRFYGPVFIMYSVYDCAEDKAGVVKTVDRHIDSFINNFKEKK